MAFTPGMEQTVSVKVESEGAEGFTGRMDDMTESLGKVKMAVGATGAALSALATGALAASVNAARNFEEAMVEVEKVTNPETAAAMTEEIQNMAETIPLAQSELAALTADAARFGIRGEENIRSFTESVARMATATNINSTEAGEALARLAELTNTPVSEVENLGSAINALSNNFATSADEVVDSMLRSSAALSQFGLNQTQIAGMSAALNEVSESSERAGTRLRRVGQELMNPKNVSEVAAALGMTAEEFRAMRENSPNDVILEMVSAFESGGDSADKLRTALSTASRQAIAGLAQNTEGLNDALKTSNDEYERATSLQEEFAAATDTFNAKIQLLTNTLRNQAIEIGNVLLPGLTEALTAVNDYIQSGDSLLSNLSSQEKAWGLVATAVGGAALAVAAFVSGPLGLLIAGSGALAAAWSKDFMGIRDTTRQAFAEIRSAGERAIGALNDVYQDHKSELRGAFSEAMSTAKTVTRDSLGTLEQIHEDAAGNVRGFWENNGSAVSSVIDSGLSLAIDVIRSGMGTFRKIWRNSGRMVLKQVRRSYNLIVTTFRGILAAIIQVVRPVLKRVERFWSEHGTIVENLISGLVNGVVGTVMWFVGRFRGLIKMLTENGAMLWSLFGDEIVAIIEFAVDSILSVLGWILEGIDSLIKTIQAILRGDWAAAWNEIAGFVEDTFNGLKDFVLKWGGRLAGWLAEAVKNVGEDALGHIDSFIEDVKTTLGDIGSAIGGAIKSAINNALGLPWEYTIGEVEVQGKTVFAGKTLSIPALAEGGVVDSATLAMVGEGRESEVVSPLSDFKEMVMGSGGGGPSTVRIILPGEELAAAVESGSEVVVEEKLGEFEEQKYQEARRLGQLEDE